MPPRAFAMRRLFRLVTTRGDTMATQIRVADTKKRPFHGFPAAFFAGMIFEFPGQTLPGDAKWYLRLLRPPPFRSAFPRTAVLIGKLSICSSER